MTELGGVSDSSGAWPALEYEAWRDTYSTLHRCLQMIGKIRLVQSPWINHAWHATYYVTSRGLTTSPMPYGSATFQADFDFVDHALVVHTASGAGTRMALFSRPVADFYSDLWARLGELGIRVRINTTPNEMVDVIPFDKDRVHSAYDPEYAQRFWRILVRVDRVFKKFRARFIGKSSPVHFFWGSFDLAVSRFSGKTAPRHPGGVPHLPDWVVREAYSHEVSSAGFWPGSGPVPYPAFYSYVYPEPNGYATARVTPSEAFYSNDMREFILPYDALRKSADPEEVLLEFMHSTYAAAADCGGWDRAALESDPTPAEFLSQRTRQRP